MTDFAPYLVDLLSGYLTEDEFHELAAYNGDSARYGGSHEYTEAEDERFAELQRRWDEANRVLRRRQGLDH